MDKKGWLLIVLIVIVLAVGAFAVIGSFKKSVGGNIGGNVTEMCNSDSDCVPAECCHPTSCAAKNQKQDCGRVFCTMNCEPGTLDCGQGSCVCINNKCEAVIK